MWYEHKDNRQHHRKSLQQVIKEVDDLVLRTVHDNSTESVCRDALVILDDYERLLKIHNSWVDATSSQGCDACTAAVQAMEDRPNDIIKRV